jgi:hypothetical protein
MYLQGKKCEVVDWIHLAQARNPKRIFAKSIENLWISENISSQKMTPVYAASVSYLFT